VKEDPTTIPGSEPSPATRRWPKIVLIVALIVLTLFIGTVYAVRKTYTNNLRAVSTSQEVVHVTIPLGTSSGEIAKLLKEKNLIRSDWAFEWYVRSQEVRNELQAGTYALTPAMSVPDIVRTMIQGKIATDLVTILPGYRLDQVKNDFVKAGFSASEVEEAFQPAQYESHPALVDKPAGISLEGYLYPESFLKTNNTTPKDIIGLSLDEMQKRLTPNLRAGFTQQGLTGHQAVILASIIEREVSKPADRAQVAQVFLKRLREGIRLESDATASYGAILAGAEPSASFDSPYNTYTHDGLPPGPISNAGESSLQAVAAPAASDWLYFVSGDDGNTYFSRTLAEHQDLVRKHCKKLCAPH
jgi:UPF0755 protein